MIQYMWPQPTIIIWITAWLFLYTAAKTGSAAPAMIWATSMLYWSWPAHGWRRNLDIFIVITSMASQVARAAAVGAELPYFATIAMAALYYVCARWFSARGRRVFSAATHSLMHILANMAILFLFGIKVL